MSKLKWLRAAGREGEREGGREGERKGCVVIAAGKGKTQHIGSMLSSSPPPHPNVLHYII